MSQATEYGRSTQTEQEKAYLNLPSKYGSKRVL